MAYVSIVSRSELVATSFKHASKVVTMSGVRNGEWWDVSILYLEFWGYFIGEKELISLRLR